MNPFCGNVKLVFQKHACSVNLQNFDTTLSVFFRIAAKPAKGKAKKPKKGKTPEPESVAPTPPPDDQLFTKVIQLSCNAKTQSILCGGGPIPV